MLFRRSRRRRAAHLRDLRRAREAIDTALTSHVASLEAQHAAARRIAAMVLRLAHEMGVQVDEDGVFGAQLDLHVDVLAGALARLTDRWERRNQRLTRAVQIAGAMNASLPDAPPSAALAVASEMTRGPATAEPWVSLKDAAPGFVGENGLMEAPGLLRSISTMLATLEPVADIVDPHGSLMEFGDILAAKVSALHDEVARQERTQLLVDELVGDDT